MIQNLALSNISPIQEFPEKTEKGKESSRRGRDAGEEEGGGRRGKEDAEPPPQATTAIAWITDKYFGTPLQVSSLDWFVTISYPVVVSVDRPTVGEAGRLGDEEQHHCCQARLHSKGLFHSLFWHNMAIPALL